MARRAAPALGHTPASAPPPRDNHDAIRPPRGHRRRRLPRDRRTASPRRRLLPIVNVRRRSPVVVSRDPCRALRPGWGISPPAARARTPPYRTRPTECAPYCRASRSTILALGTTVPVTTLSSHAIRYRSSRRSWIRYRNYARASSPAAHTGGGEGGGERRDGAERFRLRRSRLPPRRRSTTPRGTSACTAPRIWEITPYPTSRC